MTAALIERLEAATGPDWRLDDEIIAALGGTVRKVTRLGLNGRTPGRTRVFWPSSSPRGNGSAVPKYTKDEQSRAKAIALLRSMESRDG